MKVIASSLRKGNVVELDGKLYVVLTAASFHPGKGTPTTQIDMRRISDGVKVSERWKTTEQVEKAHVDEREYDYLYNDDEGFHFMEPVSYEQVVAANDVIGDDEVFLGEGVRVYLQVHNGIPISMCLVPGNQSEQTTAIPLEKEISKMSRSDACGSALFQG